MNKRPLMTALVVAIALVLAGCGSRGVPRAGLKPSASTVTTLAKQAKEVLSKTTKPVNANDVANQINSTFQGFKPGQLTIGSENVKFDGAPQERGTAAFSHRTLKTPTQVGAFLNEKTPVSQAAKQRVVEAIRAYRMKQLTATLTAKLKAFMVKNQKLIKAASAATGSEAKRFKAMLAAKLKTYQTERLSLIKAANRAVDAEVKRALDGSGYFPIQVGVAARVLGTTYFRNGKVFEMGEWRSVGPRDVFWLFMTMDGKIVFGATVRADCGNPHITVVTPLPVGLAPTSIEQICRHPGDLPDVNGLCPKHPEEDPMRNPDVPNQPKGPGCVPLPSDPFKCGPIGTHPGPPSKPVDTPTGCNGACPNPPTTTTGPPGTTTTTLPPSTTPVVTDPPVGPPPTQPPSN